MILAIATLVLSFAQPLQADGPRVITDAFPKYLPPVQYRALMLHWCAETGIPYEFACRIAYEETGWTDGSANHNKNATYDFGKPFQINQCNVDKHGLGPWAKRYNQGRPINVYDPETNIRVSLRHLAYLRWQGLTFRQIVWMWNAGTLHPPKETRAMADRVLEEKS